MTMSDIISLKESRRADHLAYGDVEAINIWASTKLGSPHTRRAYRTEALRFLCFLIEHNPDPSSGTWLDKATSLDTQNYVNFLLSEKLPFSEWALTMAGLTQQPFQKKKVHKLERSEHEKTLEPPSHDVSRGSSAMIPLMPGKQEVSPPLSKATLQRALSSLKTMYADMQTLTLPALSITKNPFQNHKASAIAASQPRKKALTTHECEYVEQAIELLKSNATAAKYHQYRWVWNALVRSGLRRSELAAANASWITQSEDENRRTIWIMSVLGKGDTNEDIPLSDQFMMEFALYRDYLGLPPLPVRNRNEVETTPLVMPLNRLADGRTHVSDKMIYRIIRTLFQSASELATLDNDHAAAQKISDLATHSTRHTCITKVIDASGDITLGRDMGRHKSITTTQHYKAKTLARLHDTLNQLDQDD